MLGQVTKEVEPGSPGDGVAGEGLQVVTEDRALWG